MRLLLPKRYSVEDATFSRTSIAYDEAGRLAGLAVPRITKTAYGKMAMVEEGTGNLLTNPKMGSVIGWGTSYGGILELITTSPNGNFPNYAEACLKGTVASGQTNCYMYQILTLLLNTTYTATVWVFVPSSIIGVARLNMSVYAGSSMAALVISERDQWVKKTVTWTTNNIDTNYSFGIGSVYGNPGDSVYACIAALEQKSYPTSWTPASRSAESLTMPTTGLIVTGGTIEGIVEINDLSKRQISGQFNRIFRINYSTINSIVLNHFATSAQWSLATYNDAGASTTVYIEDSLTPNGWYYYKVHWTSSLAKVEFWNLETQTKAAEASIVNPNMRTSFGTTLYIGSHDGTQSFLNSFFGRHRLSDIARTDDPDFNDLMPVDVNTVGIFDPTYTFLT
jgi:hypothetical protein